MSLSLFSRRPYRPVGLPARAGDAPGSPKASVAEEDFRDAMSRAVQGVAIATTEGPAGRFGVTVGSVVPASAEPPLVLACIHRRSPAAAAIVRNRSFSINLLGARHRELADVFAGRPADGAPYDFGSASWADAEGGPPMLEDAVASLQCVLHRTGRAGTHRVLVGRCIAVRTSEGPPLLYTGRRYGTPVTWDPGEATAEAIAATEDHHLSTGRRIA